MRLLPWKTLSLVIDGADLVCASLSGSPLGLRMQRGPHVLDFLHASAEEQRRALSGAEALPGRITLTVPATWCNVRPIALRCEQWSSARPEIMRSLSSLFPMAPADAVVGLIDRAAQSADGARGAGRGAPGNSGAYLVAVDRARLDPWLDAIRAALGRDVDLVLAPHMAILGLGLQSVERAEVLERQTGGAMVCHRLWRGEITELYHPLDESGAGQHITRLRLAESVPAIDNERSAPGVPRIDVHELCAAGALAPLVAPGRFAPLMGRAPHGARRWALPAAGVALGLVALWGASWTIDARYRSASERIERSQEGREQALAAVERDRSATLRLVALLDAAARGPVASPRSVLPELVAAHAALPTDGFLYRVELDGSGVTLRGESKRASDVLEQLDRTPGFRSARNVSTPAPVEERASEMFDIRAERAPVAASGGAR